MTKPHVDRNARIRSLYSSGSYTYQELAEIFGLTRQRIGSIVGIRMNGSRNHRKKLQEKAVVGRRLRFPAYYSPKWTTHTKRRRWAIEVLGGKCNKCGYNQDWRALQVDHVNNDGNIERKTKAPSLLFRQLILGLVDRSRYQVLCANCNRIKDDEERLGILKE
jgi:hypothetical protein